MCLFLFPNLCLWYGLLTLDEEKLSRYKLQVSFKLANMIYMVYFSTFYKFVIFYYSCYVALQAFGIICHQLIFSLRKNIGVPFDMIVLF